MARSSLGTARREERPARRLVLAGLFAALTAVGAQLSTPLPFSPVPIVLSNFFAILSGLVLGARLGAVSQVVYLLLGAAGAPVFARMHGGPQVLVGPTGGYLIGFILAAAAAGALRGPRPDVRRAMIAAAIAGALIYVPGIPYLAASTGMGLRRALLVGMLPFLPGDAAKVIIAGLVAPALQRAVRTQAAPAGART